MSSLKYAEPGSRPPSNAKRIYRWDDLPDAKGIERYIVNPNDANAEEIKLAKRKRQVLEGLMQGPIYAASYCRLSDQVMPLRRDYGLEIETTIYRHDDATGREKFGLYTLQSKVCRKNDGGAQ